MHTVLKKVLFLIATAIVALDLLLLAFGHFRIERAPYALLLLLVPPMVGGSLYYGGARDERAISATLACTAFLMVFSTSCCPLTYLLLPFASPQIDVMLAGIDHAMGFIWPALMVIAANHGFVTWLLKYAYLSVLPQIFILLLLLGWKNRSAELYGLCLALSPFSICRPRSRANSVWRSAATTATIW